MQGPAAEWVKSKQICSAEGSAYSYARSQMNAQAVHERNATFIMKEVVLDMASGVDWEIDRSLEQEIKVL